jgi:hypothetical protein
VNIHINVTDWSAFWLGAGLAALGFFLFSAIDEVAQAWIRVRLYSR